MYTQVTETSELHVILRDLLKLDSCPPCVEWAVNAFQDKPLTVQSLMREAPGEVLENLISSSITAVNDEDVRIVLCLFGVSLASAEGLVVLAKDNLGYYLRAVFLIAQLELLIRAGKLNPEFRNKFTLESFDPSDYGLKVQFIK